MLLGAESLQTFGGSGFLQDYPIEQYVRDAKIDTLYEGTTAIQGQDFFFRKIVKDQGAALTRLAEEIAEFLEPATAGNGRLGRSASCSPTAVEDVQAIVGAMVDATLDVRRRRRHATSTRSGLNTTRLLMALGDVVCGWLLLRQAEVALEQARRRRSREGQAFYEGKVAAAQFFARQRCRRSPPSARSPRRIDLDADGPRRGRVLTHAPDTTTEPVVSRGTPPAPGRLRTPLSPAAAGCRPPACRDPVGPSYPGHRGAQVAALAEPVRAPPTTSLNDARLGVEVGRPQPVGARRRRCRLTSGDDALVPSTISQPLYAFGSEVL